MITTSNDRSALPDDPTHEDIQVVSQAEGAAGPINRERKVGRNPNQAEGEDNDRTNQPPPPERDDEDTQAGDDTDANGEQEPGFISEGYAGGDADSEADGVG